MTSLNSKSIRELYLAIDYASEFLIAYSYDEVKNLRYSIPTHQLGLDPRQLEVVGRKRLERDYGQPIRQIIA